MKLIVDYAKEKNVNEIIWFFFLEKRDYGGMFIEKSVNGSYGFCLVAFKLPNGFGGRKTYCLFGWGVCCIEGKLYCADKAEKQRGANGI